MDKQRAIDILADEILKDQQPLYCTRKELCDAFDMAEEAIIHAKPANVPASQGCEYCNDPRKFTMYFNLKYKFCPKCGKPLKIKSEPQPEGSKKE